MLVSIMLKFNRDNWDKVYKQFDYAIDTRVIAVSTGDALVSCQYIDGDFTPSDLMLMMTPLDAMEFFADIGRTDGVIKDGEFYYDLVDPDGHRVGLTNARFKNSRNSVRFRAE